MNASQTTFGGGSNSIDEVLSMDEQVDELSEFEVIDVWARGQFMHKVIEAMGPSFMRSEDCEDIEEWLSEGNGSAIIQAAIIPFGRNHSLVRSLGWEAGEGNARTLFNRLTNDEMSKEKQVEAARRDIKSTLNGCCGMPRINVMRDRVSYHYNTEK